ncbi:TPA: hypothetical protein ACH3X2_011669 [Trebouxia sp. C0005]
MELAPGGSLVPEQPQGLKFQPLLSVRTTSLCLPIFEGTASPASGRSCVEAQAGFGDEPVNPMLHANQVKPSSAEVHVEKPLPVRQRHFRKPARGMRPATVVKAIKKTQSKKHQESSINRLATGLIQPSGLIGRPKREKKSRRDWTDFETDSDARDEIPSSPARKRMSQNSRALRRVSPESPASGDSAQEGLPNPARRALRPAPRRRTSSSEPEATQPRKKRPEGKKAEGKKKAGGPCAVCFHTTSSTWRRGSSEGLFPEEPLCNAHGTADLRGRLHLCPEAQAVICHRSDLSGAEEQQFWEESAARWRAASISPAQEEQEQNKFMSHLSWLRGCDQAAAVSSERDQQFRSERGEAAQAAGLGGGDRAVASNSHIDEQFREGQVAQDEFCRGLDGERAAEDLPMDAGIPSGTVGGSSGMAVGEQWGRAELFPQPWGVQSPRQRQRRAAEAAAVNPAPAASAEGLSTANLVSHLSWGVKRQSGGDGLPDNVAIAIRAPAAKRLRFDSSASAHAANLGEGIQQSNASAGGSDLGLDTSDDITSAAACLLGMQRRVVKVKRNDERDQAHTAA